jgi:hypothetical protein
MNYLLQLEGFDNLPPPYFPLQAMRNLHHYHGETPLSKLPPHRGGELMNIDALGLYLLRFH